MSFEFEAIVQVAWHVYLHEQVDVERLCERWSRRTSDRTFCLPSHECTFV